MKPPSETDLAVLVTGSVAAVKTFLLEDALRRRGFSPRFVVTPAAWPFLEAGGKYQAPARDVARLRRESGMMEDLRRAGAVLIAPASAACLRALARGEVDTGAASVAVAPAMNFMMWRHPAVQDNARRVLSAGMRLLGPACGGMACGDHGYGRMAEAEDIAAALADETHALWGAYRDALAENPRLPAAAPLPARDILLVVQAADAAVLPRILDWQARGYAVRCAVEPEALALAPALERATGHTVCTGHYSLYPGDGMEHIWLAEDAAVVVFWPMTESCAAEMAQGGARRFSGCLYLATKRPVIVVPGENIDVMPLLSHGATAARAEDVPAAISGMAKAVVPPDAPFGRYLVLGGSPRERVDSFRFYANAARPADHGRRVAAALGARLVEGESLREILEACRALDPGDFDGVIQLASISQFTCPAPAAHKIGKAGPERARLFAVAGNTDVMAALRDIFGAEKVMGYDNFQHWTAPDRADARALASLARRLADVRTARGGAGAATGAGPRVIVTTGRTEERLTSEGAVITNGFSGRQGWEIARAFVARGARVTLVSGPSDLPDLPGAGTLRVTTMREMQDAVLGLLEGEGADVYVSAAAISDFSAEKPFSARLAPGERMTLDLRENPSLLSCVARHARRPRVVVGFAAQAPETVLEYALQKFSATGADLTVANPIGAGTAAARDPSRNAVFFVTAAGARDLGEMPKAEVAERVADFCLK